MTKRHLITLLTLSMIWVVASCGNDDDSDSADDTGSDSDTDTDSDTDADTGEVGDGDDMVSDISVEVHDEVNTILVVNWTQVEAADNVWLRFTFENDIWYESPMKSGETGEHEEIIIGVPGTTDVTFHIVVEQGNQHAYTSAHEGTTGAVPSSMPTPTVESFDASLASPNRYLFGSVDDTDGSTDDYYYGPFWLYIIDREGRILWYYTDPADNPILGFPRISRDKRYIFASNRRPWGGNNDNFQTVVTKMTLDWSYFEDVNAPNLSDNADMTDEGTIVYNTTGYGGGTSWLTEILTNGTTRNIWNCSAVFGDECYSNTINWNPIEDSVLMSFPYMGTVVEISRQSGDMIAKYGNGSGAYDFDPSSWEFGFQHFANVSPEGTLLVSSHISNSDHGFLEFDIDRTNEVLTEKWVYNTGNEWAEYMGEVHRVENGDGNVLGNYGTGGVIKEITPDKETAWYVKWDAPFSDDRYNKMVGHSTLFNDLYELCRGPE